jgi:hypothetical protein
MFTVSKPEAHPEHHSNAIGSSSTLPQMGSHALHYPQIPDGIP